MKVYTAFVCTDGKEKWALIEERPPSLNRHWNEYARHRFTRSGEFTVTAIITDRSITVDCAKDLLTRAFSKPSAWICVNLGDKR